MKLQKLPLFGAVASALMLTAALAPKANAVTPELLYYFDFNTEANNTAPPYTSRASGSFGTNPDGSAAPLRQTTLFNQTFQGNGSGAGISIDSNGGTLTNAFITGTPVDTAGGAMTLRANTTATNTSCFAIGPMNFSGVAALSNLSLSFAFEALHTGPASAHGFTDLQLAYSFDNVTYTNFPGTTGTITTLQTTQNAYVKYMANLPTAVNGQSTVYIQFCFSGATDNGNSRSQLMDNIQVSGTVPEPSTYIGGLLGIGVLCWSQRRSLFRFLRLRRT
jgi:hypothetical protein